MYTVSTFSAPCLSFLFHITSSSKNIYFACKCELFYKLCNVALIVRINFQNYVEKPTKVRNGRSSKKLRCFNEFDVSESLRQLHPSNLRQEKYQLHLQ